MNAKEVRKRLIEAHPDKYNEENLPKERSLRSLLNLCGFKPSKVQKVKPLKKIPETDAIFEEVHDRNDKADAAENTIRISLDAKAKVNIGPFARKGKSRHTQKALDHDFYKDSVTPFGALIPSTGETHLWMIESKVTADCMADCVDELIGELLRENPRLDTFAFNVDNGPESSGSRTQWLYRIVEISERRSIKIELNYYPPYHSKFNPIERFWGGLENYWGGELLTSVGKVKSLAEGMTYKGNHPKVKIVSKLYDTGVKLSKKVMNETVEPALERLEGLEKWFIKINPFKRA